MSLIMLFKYMKKNYWLRGGLIAEAILAVFVLVIYLSGQIQIVNYQVKCFIPPCWKEFHYYFFASDSFLRTPEIINYAMLSMVSVFLVGAILGLVYGKIKHENN